ncbi:MAG: MerR family transcriptional regulator [Dehalococcoidia bacterium]|nr:MerR family transcriptional regulator [Dehalococcoidia bacterium]
MNEEELLDGEACYVISVAARMVGMHAQTLRYYERAGLLRPSRSRGRRRLYSNADIARLRDIQRLISDLGVNLAGVDVIFRMRGRMLEMEEELELLRRELQRSRDRRLPAPRE